MILLLGAVIGGYLLGSVPVAVAISRTYGFDPREVGDGNPGFWNVKERLGWRAALPVFAGDTLKGTLAALLALAATGPHTMGLAGVTGAGAVPVYLAVAAAMIGHAWPVFAGFRGGRSILAFVGGSAVICPPGFLLGVAVLIAAALVTRSFAIGARAGVFGLPLCQLLFAPVGHVAGTGALMCLIGLRFGQAARAARPGPADRAGRRTCPPEP
ncbi:acyl-phosphate glycerol-3-phosphate acyltransferase [Streptosporangium canum]|uniref:Glycerol-3-phosphate acyltransferase n=1 Tax=Streptosporangium canum TaxID=324952 RepID=A0A1I3XGH3_9ACTN|nr:glycerol-3-phosphate acyltransferase [Streptosporangium canum]SFK18667.1 acyl-phosphate glycerol-3-phosphate acyltransferase [Streptosporangium canum]